METKTHWKKLINLDYIGAYCVESDLTVKITSVGQEKVKGEKGKEEMCTVAHLEGQKPFIINRTNAKTITKLYGTPYIEDWVGKLITIFPTTCSVAGETVECLRIRSTRPQPAQKADYSLQIKMLKECQTIEDLATVYKSFSKEQQAGTANVKDEMKIKLTPKPETITPNQNELPIN